MIPMRLKKREVSDPIVLKQILQECRVVRLGLKDEEGMFIVPVNFGYEMAEEETENPGLRLYFHSAADGRKVDALACDPHVAVEMDCGYELITGDYSCSFSNAYKSIMGNGQARLVTDPDEKIHGLTLIMEHTAPCEKPAFREEALNCTHVYCIDLVTYTGKMRQQKQKSLL